MNNAFSLLIHGPLEGQWIDEIVRQVRQSHVSFESIVVVGYAAEEENYRQVLEKFFQDIPFSLVCVPDLINPGFFNINRQIHMVSAGLAACPEDSLVFKLRNDQCVDFNEVAKLAPIASSGKIVTTNCFTRRDRLYHPSDMFLFSSCALLKKYYSCPLMKRTHLGHQLDLQLQFRTAPESMKSLPLVPESYLFREYLKVCGYCIKETPEDSLHALRQFMYVVNSWDISFRWNKKRTPFYPKGSLILPYTYNIRPFAGAPKEHASCLARHEVNGGKPTIKDIFYIKKSLMVFSLSREARCAHKPRFKYVTYKLLMELLRATPYFIYKKYCNKLKKKIEKYKNGLA